MIRALLWQGGIASELDHGSIADMIAMAGDKADGFAWIHLQADERNNMALDELSATLPASVERALVAMETRPRCEPFETGVLVNLRGPRLDDYESGDGDILSSVRLWAEKGLLLSVCFRPTTIIAPVEAQFLDGQLHDPGDVIIALSVTAAQQLDDRIAAIGDEVDDIECTIDRHTPFSERRRVTRIRTQAISYRRFVVPQRQALERMAALPLNWLDSGERDALREAADRFARMGEELESVRERSAVLHEELTDLRSEKIDRRSLQIAIVAMIFLPLTFITGLLGMNVEGIPFAGAPWAFWGVTAFCLAVATAIALWFFIVRWSQR
jgi:zinc transporter